MCFMGQHYRYSFLNKEARFSTIWNNIAEPTRYERALI